MEKQSSSEIKLISECFVKPNQEPEESKQPHHLGPADLVLLSTDQLQKGLLFDSKPESLHSFLDKLKHCLSLTLVHFYPLAGQLATEKFPDEHAILVYVDSNKGPGVRLTHAALDLGVSDIVSSTDVHPIVRSFFDLGEKSVNHDGHTKPLLSVQVTELLDGVFIGVTMNHSVADGTSIWHFITSLSEVFVQFLKNDDDHMSISRKPVFKPLFPDGCGPVIKLPYLEPEEFVTRYDPGELRERIFRFSAVALSKIKAKAVEESGVKTISTFQALSALVWRSFMRAKGPQPDDIPTICGILMNFRPRLEPPLSLEHFGNIVGMGQSICKVSELLGHDLGWAAVKINQGLKVFDDKVVRAYLKIVMETTPVFQPGGDSYPNFLVIGGSSKFDTYGPDFGLGKAVAVLTGYAGKSDGKVTANPGREGGGSVELEICLKPETMNALESDEEFMSFVTSV